MSTKRRAYVSDLHTYRIHDGLLEEWLSVWRSEVLPLRRAHGFRIQSAYADEERSRFAWVLCSDADDERERTRRYWADQLATGVNPVDYIAEHRIHRVRRGTRRLAYADETAEAVTNR